MNLSLGFNLIFRIMALKSDCLLELSREFVKFGCQDALQANEIRISGEPLGSGFLNLQIIPTGRHGEEPLF